MATTQSDVVAVMKAAVAECARENARRAKGSGLVPLPATEMSAEDCDCVVERVEERAGRKPTRAEWTETFGRPGFLGSRHYEG